MSDRHLLVRPIPYSDEAPIGVLLRAAYINGWATTSDLLKAYRIDPNRAIHIDSLRLQKIFDLLGIAHSAKELVFSPGDARGNFRLGSGISLPNSQLRTSIVPVCVLCLQERGYIRQWWCLRLICCCGVHKCSLVFVCPDCQSLLNAERPGPCLCACGRDLRSVESTPAADGCLYMHEALRRGYHQKIKAIGELFLLLEEADITRNAQDIHWCDAAVALHRDEARSVKMLVELVRRSSQREHPRLTLGGFLVRTDHVRQRALQALAQLTGLSTGPPTVFDSPSGVVSWHMTKAVLGLPCDSQLNAIWRCCLIRHSSEKNRHTFTRASLNAFLWTLSDLHSRKHRSGVEVSPNDSASLHTLGQHILETLARAGVHAHFDLVFGFSRAPVKRMSGNLWVRS
ncbi:hypothetical protein P3T43_003956 [Paraburkholderia sp. GAS41]|uniref:TniQ family protein n=1 Tax=Paraburkholderia sp. GAS41 TaxID=3035134 RepID=UPI003D207D21